MKVTVGVERSFFDRPIATAACLNNPLNTVMILIQLYESPFK